MNINETEKIKALLSRYQPKNRTAKELAGLVGNAAELGEISQVEFKTIEANWDLFKTGLSELSFAKREQFLKKLAVEWLNETIYNELELTTSLERSLAPYRHLSSDFWSGLLSRLQLTKFDPESAGVVQKQLELIAANFSKDWNTAGLKFLEPLRPDVPISGEHKNLSFRSWFYLHGKVEYPALFYQINYMYFFDHEVEGEYKDLISNLFLHMWYRRPDLHFMDIRNEAGRNAFFQWALHEGKNEQFVLSPMQIAELFKIDRQTGRLKLSDTFNEDPSVDFDSSKVPKFKFFEFYLGVFEKLQAGLMNGEPPCMSVLLDIEPLTDFVRSENLQDAATIIGYVRNEFGLGEYARSTYFALKEKNEKTSLYSIQPPGHPNPSPFINLGTHVSNEIKNKVNIFCLPLADYMTARILRGSGFTSGIYNIGFAPWEFNVWNKKYASCFDGLSEVWAISDYSAEGFRSACDLPVYTMPITVNPLPEVKGDKRKFGLNDGFTFMFFFDFNSTVFRKNPFGLVKAFKEAFPDPKDNVQLVIKTMYKGVNAIYEAQFSELCGDDPRIKVINQVYPRNELIELMDCCDCYVSLHRSEGFGMTLAEAMLLNKPVISTGYSGSLEVANAETAYLVDYKLIPVSQNEYNMSEGAEWADPDLSQAAQLMREVRFSDREKLEKKTSLARKYIQDKFFAENAARVYQKRIDDILRSL